MVPALVLPSAGRLRHEDASRLRHDEGWLRASRHGPVEQSLISTTLNGITTRSVEHPEHGPLIMAADLVGGLGYSAANTTQTLRKANVPAAERVLLRGASLSDGQSGARLEFGVASFLTRKGVNLVLMWSGKPIAQETRQWLAGDVMPAIADTGGYLLNEAARETARADTRQVMPLPALTRGWSAP